MQKDYAKFGVKHAQGQELDAKQTLWILMAQRHLLTKEKTQYKTKMKRVNSIYLGCPNSTVKLSELHCKMENFPLNIMLQLNNPFIC